MARILILVVLIGGLFFLAMPFVVSSVYVDQRGVTIPGRVYSKDEYVTLPDASWKRWCEVTVQYDPPDGAGVEFLKTELKPEEYDGYHKGQAVTLHYLQRKDVPDLPMARALTQMHALPRARLTGQRAFTKWIALFTPGSMLVLGIAGAVLVVLVAWKRSKLPGFAMGVFACVLAVLGAILIGEFPTRMPAPAGELGHAAGKVKSINRITMLFEGRRTRGLDADQPIAVLGVEFVPEGRAEPVVAVDLIDDGSLAGLRQDLKVEVDYERASPRTAAIRGATRNFPEKNLRGIEVAVGAVVLAVAGFLAFLHLWEKRSTNRSNG